MRGAFRVSSNKSTDAIVQLIVDRKLHDNMVSREINFRPNDLSSAFKRGLWSTYLTRLFNPDGDTIVERVIEKDPILFLMTHQLMHVADPLFDLFGEEIFH